MKRRKSNVDEYNDSWTIVHCIRFPGKGEPVGMISNSYQWNVFVIVRAKDGSYYCLGWFLDENDVEVVVDFKDHVNDEIIFSDILWKNFQFL